MSKLMETYNDVDTFAQQSKPDMRVVTLVDGLLCHTDMTGTERKSYGGRQGDIYYVRINDLEEIPRNGGNWNVKDLTGNLTKVTDRQLAPGTTKGSRHIADGDVQVFVARNRHPLVGPVVKSKTGFIVRHPEHADHQLPPGDYQFFYQQDKAQEEIAAVRD